MRTIGHSQSVYNFQNDHWIRTLRVGLYEDSREKTLIGISLFTFGMYIWHVQVYFETPASDNDSI